MSKLTAYVKFIQQALKYGFSLFGLPPTGQVISYTAGDDGDYKKGYPRSGARLVDNGDGTITDNATGLMWPKDGNGAGCFNHDTKDWLDAITWAEALDFAGHTDWRMPNLKELLSILDARYWSPAIDPSFFINTGVEAYSSSTTRAQYTATNWFVHFSAGTIASTAKTTPIHVRAVRGGFPS